MTVKRLKMVFLKAMLTQSLESTHSQTEPDSSRSETLGAKKVTREPGVTTAINGLNSSSKRSILSRTRRTVSFGCQLRTIRNSSKRPITTTMCQTGKALTSSSSMTTLRLRIQAITLIGVEENAPSIP